MLDHICYQVLNSDHWQIFQSIIYFDSDLVQKTCDATNEYAVQQKYKHPVMYPYLSLMMPDDFYAVVGIFVTGSALTTHFIENELLSLFES